MIVYSQAVYTGLKVEDDLYVKRDSGWIDVDYEVVFELVQ